jgi:hypothetical protein
MNQKNLKQMANNSQTANLETLDFESQEKELASVLGAYRQSVHAWSADLMERQPVRRFAHKPASSWSVLTWRFATFAMSGLMLAALAGGGLIQYERNIDAKNIAQQQANQKKLDEQKNADEKQAAEAQLAANQNMQDDELLAAVDSDVAQQTPEAMEPLASLMNSADEK